MSSNETVKILLVDDQLENLLALEAVLEGTGQELVKARSGPEALKLVLANDFAVILLDVKMPGMDGFETAALIRNREKSRHTSIIFLTAYHSEEQLFRGYYAGAVDYLLRPVVPEVLRSKVSVFVDLYRKAQLLEGNAKALEAKNRELAELYQKVRELDDLKTKFFANISHELRTPLALILGLTEKLRADGALGEKHRSELEVVERNSRTLLKHVNDLLDVARLEAGRMDLEYRECDLVELVAVTAAHFQGLAEQRRISFTVDAPACIPAQVDPEKLQRVLLNLLSNAFKFVADGGRVQCGVCGEVGRVQITVQDDGPGVPASMRQVIFERFRKGDGRSNPASHRFGGTGLGLAIAREFTELHNGTLSVGNAPGGGASFTVDLPTMAPPGTIVGPPLPEPAEAPLPARQALEELQPRSHERTERPVENDGRPLVLVVEDSPEMNRFLTESLAPEYRTVSAFDGKEGLRQALAVRPDLILGDVMMPGMSGDEMVHRISADAKLSTIPVVLLTARADPEFRTSLLRAGAQDYLVKPFSVEEMRARIRNLIVMKRAREALQKELESQSHNLTELVEELAVRKRQEQAARAQAEAANRAKDDFLATVSHELRTPLTAVLGWSSLLRGGYLDKETTSRALEAIERNAKAQTQLINDILDVSRIVSGKLRLDVRPVDLGAVIEAALDVVRPAAEAKGFQLEIALEADERMVLGDPDRLQQVVWNLLSNAVKFTPEGGQILVRLRRVSAELEFSVSDTGEGISPEFLPHVFEPFRQAEASSTRSTSGLGLGLAIVRHLVELHGGSARAESSGVGQGAAFIVSLRLLNDSGLGGRKSVSPPLAGEVPAESSVNLQGVRVLVVDDEGDTRDMVTTILRQYGAVVASAASAAEALAALNRFQPDVILSDIEMPGEDGCALIRKVRSLEVGRSAWIPAAALTAYARTEDRARAFAAGFQKHLPKPIEPVELATAVADLAGRR